MYNIDVRQAISDYIYMKLHYLFAFEEIVVEITYFSNTYLIFLIRRKLWKYSSKLLIAATLLLTLILVGCGNSSDKAKEPVKMTEKVNPVQNESQQTQEPKELEGEITMWHSFTQGPRLNPFKRRQTTLCKNIQRLRSQLKLSLLE